LAKDVYVHSQKAVDIKQFANGNANDGSSIIHALGKRHLEPLL